MDWRREWFEFEDVTYLNAAWQGPLPRVSVQAAQEAIEWKKYPYQIPGQAYFDLPDRSRSLFARLIKSEASEIAITTGASGGLATLAMGVDLKPEDEVLVARGDFLAHVATWGPLAQAGQLRLNVVAPRQRFITAEDFYSVIGPRTRLVSVSLVQPYDGALVNGPSLAEACHSVGAFLLLDVTQCVGAMPLDVRTLGADFLVSAGYKWLFGPYGTGFLWVRAALSTQMRPSPVNWTAVESVSAEHIKVTPDARRWDAPETASFFNLPALSCSLEFLLRVGAETVWKHNQSLITQMISRLPLDHCALASPADLD